MDAGTPRENYQILVVEPKINFALVTPILVCIGIIRM